jgi:DNA-binding IclR family transcriptional regulator
MLNDSPPPKRALAERKADEKRKGGIQSVAKVFQVLNALAQSEGPSRLSALSSATGLSPSLLRAYLLNLQDVGMVYQDPVRGLYDLGGAAVHLGMAALRRLDAMALAAPLMTELADKVGEPVSLSIWGDTGPLVVHNVERNRNFPYDVNVGTVAGATTTAAGRCFLAHLPKSRWRHLVARERRELGPAVPDAQALDSMLETIRRTGLATRSSLVATREDVAPLQIHALAAPVFKQSGAIHAAMVIISQDPEFDLTAGGVPGSALSDAARRLSKQLGHFPPAST